MLEHFKRLEAADQVESFLLLWPWFFAATNAEYTEQKGKVVLAEYDHQGWRRYIQERTRSLLTNPNSKEANSMLYEALAPLMHFSTDHYHEYVSACYGLVNGNGVNFSLLLAYHEKARDLPRFHFSVAQTILKKTLGERKRMEFEKNTVLKARHAEIQALSAELAATKKALAEKTVECSRAEASLSSMRAFQAELTEIETTRMQMARMAPVAKKAKRS
jgi:hypothetical protein